MNIRLVLKKIKDIFLIEWDIKKYNFVLNKVSIGAVPFFSSQEQIDYFMEKLKDCKFYLEYGSGGSTIAASKLNIKSISIDNDRDFIEVLDKYLPNKNRNKIVHRDIGITKFWGFPTGITVNNKIRKKLYSDYSSFPVLDEYPDLILIDGRFRVACALKALRSMKDVNDFILIVDDYKYRDYYSIISEFSTLIEMIGIMAVFKGTKNTDLIEKVLLEYEYDSR